MSNCLWPHGPTRYLCPWDFPCKNTGEGCYALHQGISPDQGLGLVSYVSFIDRQVLSTSATWEVLTPRHLENCNLQSRLQRWINGKESTCQAGVLRFNPWLGKIPWRRKWQPISSILAWEILWTEEPGGLQSMGLQRVRHDSMTKKWKLTIKV